MRTRAEARGLDRGNEKEIGAKTQGGMEDGIGEMVVRPSSHQSFQEGKAWKPTHAIECTSTSNKQTRTIG